MSFIDIVKSYDLKKLSEFIYSRTDKDIISILGKKKIGEYDMAALLSPAAKKYLPELAKLSNKITLERFGKTIKIYAPLYISNACVNSCVYCGFNRHNLIPRITLNDDEIRREAEIIAAMGIKNVVVVSGDNPKEMSDNGIIRAVEIAAEYFPMVSVEVRSLSVETYAKLNMAGADGFTMFQESYLEDEYPLFHPAGPKADYLYRLDSPERAAMAGMRSIGFGALLGLTDFRLEVFFLSLHAKYIASKYWQSHVSASFPRIRPCAGGYSPKHSVTDGELLQSIMAFRLFLHDAGINISTRESPELRDKLIHLGATIMSAGSKTEPGGYYSSKEDAEQFHIGDERSVEEFCLTVKKFGYDPVMKDWDTKFHGGTV